MKFIRLRKISTFVKHQCQKINLSGEQKVDVIKTICNAILIGLIGTMITRHYQTVAEQKTIFEQSRKTAQTAVDCLTDKLFDRHFYALRCAAGYRWNLSDPNIRYSEYDESIKRWNKDRGSMLSTIKRYFGVDARNRVYGLIKNFDSIHNQLMDIKRLYDNKKPLPDLSPLMQEIYKLDDTISTFIDDLQTQLQTGRVDIYSPQPPLKNPNN